MILNRLKDAPEDDIQSQSTVGQPRQLVDKRRKHIKNDKTGTSKVGAISKAQKAQSF